MNLMRMLPDWLIIAGVLLAPLMWVFIGKIISTANPERWRLINKVALTLWLVLLMYGAVFSRWDMGLAPAEWQTIPFRNFSIYTMKQVYLNIAMFEPIGMTVGALLQGRKSLASQLCSVLLIGLAVSVSIELLQQLLVLGAFQMDDIIWNVVGCVVGASGSYCVKSVDK